MISFPVISTDSRTQVFYIEMRRDGQSHNLAEMLALRRCPSLDTDTRFNAGLGTLRSHFKDEAELYRVVAAAKKQGYTPKSTDSYQPFMANRCGDPAAFVPHDNPKSHVRKVCEKRDISCHGAVEVKRKAKG